MMKRMMTLLAAVFLLSTSIAAATQSTGQTEGVLHYRFNESAEADPVEDWSNSTDYDGTNNGASVQASGVDQGSGDWGDGLAFDLERANGDDVDTGEDGGLEAAEITMMAWVKAESLDTGVGNNYIISNEGSNTNGYKLENNGGTWSFAYLGDGSVTGNSAATALTHLAGKRNSTHLVIYENGTLTGIAASASAPSTDSTDNTLIGEFPAGNRQWDGIIDEPRIYNRTLTDTQVNNVFQDNCFQGAPCTNHAPTIDNNETRPAANQITTGDQVDTVVNATDADGDTMQAWANVSFNNGTIIDFSTMTQPTTGDFQIVDQFSTNVLNQQHHINFTVSDGFVNTTSSIKFTITDNPPTITLNTPGNQTLWTYDNHILNATVDDDRSPWSNISVTLDGNNIVNDLNNTVKFFTVNTTRNDLGPHNFTVRAYDNQQQSNAESQQFTVEDIRLLNTSNRTPTFETFNETFNTSHKIGAMINTLNTTLYWNNTPVFTRDRDANGVTTFNDSHYHDIGLVSANNTFINWTVQRRINRTNFNTGHTIDRQNVTRYGNQTVFHGFYFNNSLFVPADANYTAGVSYTHRVNITNKTGRADITATNTYWRTGGIKTNGLNAIVQDKEQYELGQDVGNVTSGVFDRYNSSTEFKIEFQQYDRFFTTTNDTLTIQKPTLRFCNNFPESDTVALNITTRDEKDRDPLKPSDLTGTWQIWKNPAEKSSYNFSTGTRKFHEFCIFPENETLTLDNTNDRIRYDGGLDDDAQGFARRSYYFVNETIDNVTKRVNLYMLNETESSTVEYTVEDEDGDLATGIVVAAERYFESEDRHLRVAMLLTGSEGTSRTELEAGDNQYQHKFFDDGKLVDEKEDQVVPDDFSFEFQIGVTDTPGYFGFKDGVSYSCFTATTYVNCTYSSDTEDLDEVTLTVQRQDAVGSTLIQKTTASTTSGEVIVNGLNSTNNTYRYTLKALFNDDTQVILESEVLQQISTPFNKLGVFVSFALIITLGFAGLFIPEAVILLSAFGVLVSAATDLLALPDSSLVGLVILTGFLLWRMT